MPSLSFTLSDVGLVPLDGRYPRVHFIPDRPSTTPVHLLATAPVEAEHLGDGEYTVTVIGSDETIPPILYTVRVTWDVGRELDVITGLAIPQGVTSLWAALIATGQAAPYAPIVHGYGPPPRRLSNVLYIDRSGVRPVLHVPPGGDI